ncbi:Retrovirus-related Pol polyprotein from transposon RE2, partial [Bienertia sinuspersici]
MSAIMSSDAMKNITLVARLGNGLLEIGLPQYPVGIMKLNDVEIDQWYLSKLQPGFPAKNPRSHRDSRSKNKETGGRKPPGREGGKFQGKDKGKMDATDEDSDDDMEINYAGLMLCNMAKEASEAEWILDTGATHHMTGTLNLLNDPCKVSKRARIKLPNGESSEVTHSGTVRLKSDLRLNNVMLIPSFKHNLISVQKLTKQLYCKATFVVDHCIIQKTDSHEVIAVGKAVHGVYYLINEPIKKVLKQLKECLKKSNSGERRNLAVAAAEL